MDLQNLRNRVSGALNGSGLSQAEFATTYGLSYSTFNKFLKGKLRNPRLSTIQQYETIIRRSSKGRAS